MGRGTQCHQTQEGGSTNGYNHNIPKKKIRKKKGKPPSEAGERVITRKQVRRETKDRGNREHPSLKGGRESRKF